jgi:hypothetical protein
LVPAIYDEGDDSFEYFYDMEFFAGHSLLSECGEEEQILGVRLLVERLGSGVYSAQVRSSAPLVDWLRSHLAAKIYAKLNDMSSHSRLDSVVNSPEILVNDEVYPGLTALLRQVEEAEHIQCLAPTRLSAVHGDLTFENVLLSQNDIRVIDMDGAEYVDAAELDLGKLYQSVVAGYERWAHSSRMLVLQTKPTEYRTTGDSRFSWGVGLQAPELQSWSTILGCSPDLAHLRGQFFMSLHLLRMIPFRLRMSEDQALFALLGAIVHLTEVLKSLSGRYAATWS